MITLQEIMSPKSIAIVGASDNKARIGGRPLAHMIEQKFSGGISQLILIGTQYKV